MSSPADSLTPIAQPASPALESDSPSSHPVKRNVMLDVLRFLAVFLVLGAHMGGLKGVPTADYPPILYYWQHAGWIGVDLFFVLSGFLVSGLLFKEYARFGQINVGRFYVRRGLKIYPAFYFFMGISLLYLTSGGQELGWRRIWGEVFFLQNYIGSVWGHTWTLAVEEHFYIMIPLLLLVLAKRNRGAADPFPLVPAIFVVMAVALLAWRLINIYVMHYNEIFNYRMSHLRADSLMVGVLLAYYYHYQRAAFDTAARKYRWRLILGGLGISLLPAAMLRHESAALQTVGFTGFYLGFGAILTACIDIDLSRSRIAATLAFFGAHSYSIYLWHIPVREWVIPAVDRQLGGDQPFWLALGIYLGVSLIAGVVMAKLVEFPIIHLRDRLFPSRSGAPVKAN